MQVPRGDGKTPRGSENETPPFSNNPQEVKEKPQSAKHTGRFTSSDRARAKNKNLKVRGTASLRVTISPQRQSGSSPHSLSPRFTIRNQHTDKTRHSPSNLLYAQQQDDSKTNTPAELTNTVLNILADTPSLTIRIHPPLNTQSQLHRPLQPLPTPWFWSHNDTPIDSEDESKTSDEVPEQEKDSSLKIILPGGEERWSISLEEESPPKPNPPSASEIEPLLTGAMTDWQTESPNQAYQYRELLSNIAYHLLLLALVSPNGINAFCEPSRVKPANLSGAWWNNLSTETQFLSITNLVFSLGVNVFVQRDFIPQALNQLRDGFGKCFQSTTNFVGNSLTLVSSSAAAFSFAAMSSEAFKWMGNIAPIFSGLASLGTTFMTRYPSVKKATQKIHLFFDENQRFQKKMADRLRHLQQNPARTFTELVQTNHYKLNNHDLAQLLRAFGEETDGLALTQLIRPRTTMENLKDYSWLALETSFSAVIASTAFITFTQKGFDGANAITHLFHSNLDDLSPAERFAIGGIGGTVSAMLYIIAGLNLLPSIHYVSSTLFSDVINAGRRFVHHPRTTLQETIANPHQFLRFLKLSLACLAVWRSSGAMTTVGNGVAHNEKGIFSFLFQFWPAYKASFAALNGLGGFAINFTATINQILKHEREEKRKNPQLDDFARHLEEVPLPRTLEVAEDGEIHLVPTVSHLKLFSLFKAEARHEKSTANIELINRQAYDLESDGGSEVDPTQPLLEDLTTEEEVTVDHPKQGARFSQPRFP